jgi:hypothetical protein
MRSILYIILLAILLLLLTWLAAYFGNWLWHDAFFLISAFLVLLSLLSHQINLRSVNQQGRAVIIPYIASIVIKLLLSGTFLFIIVMYNQQIVKSLVIVFLIYYASFSVLEIYLVNRRVKGKKF